MNNITKVPLPSRAVFDFVHRLSAPFPINVPPTFGADLPPAKPLLKGT